MRADLRGALLIEAGPRAEGHGHRWGQGYLVAGGYHARPAARAPTDLRGGHDESNPVGICAGRGRLHNPSSAAEDGHGCCSTGDPDLHDLMHVSPPVSGSAVADARHKKIA